MNDESALAQEAGPEVVTEAQEAEGQVEDQTAEAAEPVATDEETEAKSKAAARRERDKAYKERLRTDREAAEARARDAEAKLQSLYRAAQAQAEPTEATISDPFELAAAKALWMQNRNNLAQSAAEIKEQAEAARAEGERLARAEQAAISAHWQAQAKEAESRYTDFRETISRPGLFPEGSAVAVLVAQSPVAADLAYALARDPATHDALLNMRPLDVAREIGRLEASLSTPRPRTATTAPPPVSPVKGSAPAGKDPARMTGAEFIAWRMNGGAI